jgi:hypothetical protein
LYRFGRGSGILRLCLLTSLRLRTRTKADLFERICQNRGDELDGAGTPELVHHIRGEASPPYEQVLGSYTRRKLTQLPIWDIRLASEWRQLYAHQKQNIFGVVPPGALHSESQSRLGPPVHQ